MLDLLEDIHRAPANSGNRARQTTILHLNSTLNSAQRTSGFYAFSKSIRLRTDDELATYRHDVDTRRENTKCQGLAESELARQVKA